MAFECGVVSVLTLVNNAALAERAYFNSNSVWVQPYQTLSLWCNGAANTLSTDSAPDISYFVTTSPFQSLIMMGLLGLLGIVCGFIVHKAIHGS